MNNAKTKQLFSKVPQITIFFWIIKVLCTTVGETFSDFLNVNLGFGLVGTSVVMGITLAIALFFQIKSEKYIPSLYWINVVLISVFGTLVTDYFTDKIGVPLQFSTIFFTVLLAVTFFAWFKSEKTLSIHSIFTRKRESFYWLAIFFTFALGTASGDLMAEGLGLGYLVTGLIVCGVIIATSVAWKLGLDSILSFWIIYIMTRPLGASIGDFLSQPTANGGLGLGATITSVIFLLAILAVIIYLTLTKKDFIEQTETSKTRKGNVMVQLVAVVGLLLVLSVGGYMMRTASLANEAKASAPNGITASEMAEFVTIEQDMLTIVDKGDFAMLVTRARDLEKAWDDQAARLGAIDKQKWTTIDGTIDTVLTATRAKNPDANLCKDALNNSLKTME